MEVHDGGLLGDRPHILPSVEDEGEGAPIGPPDVAAPLLPQVGEDLVHDPVLCSSHPESQPGTELVQERRHPHVVRDVVDLGSGSGGELAYTLPDEWDGEDISLVLIHQWSAPPPTVVIEDKGFLPAAGLALVVTAIGLALLERRSRV